jgi:deoxyribose-phosphate aldolase
MEAAGYEDLAGIIEHPLLAPEIPTSQVLEGLARAKRYGIAAAIVRPCDIDVAVRTLEGSPVRAGSVVGFPHGTQTTGTKLFEARDLLRRGAKELEAVVGIPQLLNREFQHVQSELNQLSDLCRQENAVLKVTLEMPYLTEELKIIAVVCCERADVHIVKTTTGFARSGYTLSDLKLLREYLPEEIGICAAGDIVTLEQALEVKGGFATRISTPAPAAILDAWKIRLAAATSTAS